MTDAMGRVALYLVFAPIFGGLLAGLDRKITARMQARVGPPLLQPFFDVAKLMEKENLVVRRSQNFYILFFLIFSIFTGALFYSGLDLLLVIFAMTLAGIFFALGGFKASSPYSFIGADRELLQMMSYEPPVLFAAIGMYMVTKSFYVRDIAAYPEPLYLFLPGLLIAFIFILPLKFRKSPFDLSTSHHGHQELVKGITTEFSGRTMAMIEVAHWYENALVLGFVYLFFGSQPVVAVTATLLIYFFIIVVDNTFARAKWQMTLASSWIMALTFGLGNIIILFFFPRA
jgi:ech hydrogenase subunit B